MSAGRTARALRECSQRLETELATLTAERDQLRSAIALGGWAHTCIHHNDKQRAKAKGCPVCATSEVERLKKQALFDADHIHDLNAAFATRAEVERAHAATHHWCARAKRARAALTTERARMKKIETAFTDAISTYFGDDKLVSAKRIEAWQAALKEEAK